MHYCNAPILNRTLPNTDCWNDPSTKAVLASPQGRRVRRRGCQLTATTARQFIFYHLSSSLEFWSPCWHILFCERYTNWGGRIKGWQRSWWIIQIYPLQTNLISFIYSIFPPLQLQNRITAVSRLESMPAMLSPIAFEHWLQTPIAFNFEHSHLSLKEKNLPRDSETDKDPSAVKRNLINKMKGARGQKQ